MTETISAAHLRRIEILFEFKVANPRPTIYRAVRATDGIFRMEKRGPNAKKFRAVMWCSTEESLHKFKEAMEFCFKK